MRAHFRSALRELLPVARVMLVLTVLRWIFYLANRASFPGVGAADVTMIALQGLRFDAMTVTVANALWIVLVLLPLPWHERRGWRLFLRILFVVVNVALLMLCCIDLAYFGFNGKRLTRDLLGQAGAGLRELPGMAIRFWWVTLVFLATLLLLLRASRGPATRSSGGPGPRLLVFVVLAGLLVLAGRGGWQYQGLSPAHANDHVEPSFAPLVTNSAFTFGYSLTEPVLEQRSWFAPEEVERIVPLRYELHADSSDRRLNVVLLIVESLSREYLGSLNGGGGHVPFIDSLCSRSLVLTDAYANAERSNKGICAILAGIPSFTDDAFMNTAFAGNAVEGLGTRLKGMGYSTAFFHGGLNGEYKFDSFSRACGFDRFFGRDEFGDDRYYDGHWGVYDEEFLQYVADRLGELPEPFCAVEFTISSHDPFVIPDRYRGKFPKGTQEIHEAMGYTDMAVRRFFERIRREPWYPNTLFVITGDHTFQYNDHPAWYMNPAGRFSVPILFFRPDGKLEARDDRTAQHLDIAPSILDFCGYEGPLITFGQSVFRRDRPDRAIIRLGGEYRMVQEGRMLLFDGREATGLYDHRGDTLFARDLRASEPERAERLTRDLKAMIQEHAQLLVRNTMVAR